MSFRYPWAKKIFPHMCWVSAEGGFYVAPKICDDPTHVETEVGPNYGQITCFKAKSQKNTAYPLGLSEAGWFGLKTENLINVANDIPGTGNKFLTGLKCGGMHRYDGSVVTAEGGAMSAKVSQGGTLFGSKNLQFDTDLFNFDQNKLLLNVDLTSRQIPTLYVELWISNKSNILLWGGWAETHVRDLIIEGYYYTDVPPDPTDLTITVVDSITQTPVRDAQVTLLIESQPRFSAKTNSQGIVYFTDPPVPEATYSIVLSKPYYRTYTGTITVQAPATSKIYGLEYTGQNGGLELPWWWYIPVLGFGGVIVSWMIIKGKRRQQPIIVVK